MLRNFKILSSQYFFGVSHRPCPPYTDTSAASVESRATTFTHRPVLAKPTRRRPRHATVFLPLQQTQTSLGALCACDDLHVGGWAAVQAAAVFLLSAALPVFGVNGGA